MHSEIYYQLTWLMAWNIKRPVVLITTAVSRGRPELNVDWGYFLHKCRSSWLKLFFNNSYIHMKYSPCFRCYTDTSLHSQNLIILVNMPLWWTYLNLYGFLILFSSLGFHSHSYDCEICKQWLFSFFFLSDCCYDTTDIIGRSQACFSNNVCDELANIWWMPSCLWEPSILKNNEGNTIWRSFLWFDLYFR
jgi:hypothetical protein